MKGLILVLFSTLALGATGNVQALGITFDSGNSGTSTPCSNAFDHDGTTAWEMTTTSGYCGLNIGASAPIVSATIIGRLSSGGPCGNNERGGPVTCWNTNNFTCTLKGSMDDTRYSTIDTLPRYDPRGYWTEELYGL